MRGRKGVAKVEKSEEREYENRAIKQFSCMRGSCLLSTTAGVERGVASRLVRDASALVFCYKLFHMTPKTLVAFPGQVAVTYDAGT